MVQNLLTFKIENDVDFNQCLKAVTRLSFLADDIQNRVNKLSAFGVVTLGPIIARTRLSEYEIVRSKLFFTKWIDELRSQLYVIYCFYILLRREWFAHEKVIPTCLSVWIYKLIYSSLIDSLCMQYGLLGTTKITPRFPFHLKCIWSHGVRVNERVLKLRYLIFVGLQRRLR